MSLIPYFPNPFSSVEAEEIFKPKEGETSEVLEQLKLTGNYQFVDSGRKAITLLLKSFNFDRGEKVGVPCMICSSVVRAIKNADLTPVFFDIAPDFRFRFEETPLKKANIKCLILPHFFGYLNPDTRLFLEWAKENNVKIIQDTAQSYKLLFEGKPVIECGDGGIYSFGPGKAINAAGGCLVYGLNDTIAVCPNFVIKAWSNFYAKKLLSGRLNNRKKSNLIGFIDKINSLFVRIVKSPFKVNSIQQKAILKLACRFEDISEERSKRWQLFYDNLNPDGFKRLPYLENSMKYKYVFYMDESPAGIDQFIKEVESKGINVSHFSYFRIDNKFNNNEITIRNYNKVRHQLLEISCEATISMENTLKAIEILNARK